MSANVNPNIYRETGTTEATEVTETTDATEATETKVPIWLEEDFRKGEFAIGIETDADWEMLPDQAFCDIRGKSLKREASSINIFSKEQFPIHGIWGMNKSGNFCWTETKDGVTMPIINGTAIANFAGLARTASNTNVDADVDYITIDADSLDFLGADNEDLQSVANGIFEHMKHKSQKIPDMNDVEELLSAQ